MMGLLGGLALLIPADSQSEPLFAPFHFGMIVAPHFHRIAADYPLIRTAYCANLPPDCRGDDRGRVQRSACPSPGISGFCLVAALVFAGASIFPAGQAEVSRLVSIVQLWAETPPTNIEAIMSIATSPVAIAGIILVLSFLAPLIEEFVKTLVMGVMGIWMRPEPGMAFIWGVACGLGFALVEGITNGSIGFGNAGLWLGAIFARVTGFNDACPHEWVVGFGVGFVVAAQVVALDLILRCCRDIAWFVEFQCGAVGGWGAPDHYPGMDGWGLALTGGGMLVVLIVLVIAAFITIPLLLATPDKSCCCVIRHNFRQLRTQYK